MTALNQQYYIR
jgi:hypothetical protein